MNDRMRTDNPESGRAIIAKDTSWLYLIWAL